MRLSILLLLSALAGTACLDPAGAPGEPGEGGDAAVVAPDCMDERTFASIADLDRDGWYAVPAPACMGIAQALDCDDDDPDRNPGLVEVECNGLDEDCDEATPDRPDSDGDGSPDCMDCADLDPERAPGLPELCDGVDNDCDGQLEPGAQDDDGDGWSLCAGDCDDADPEAFPGAAERCNGLDDDCDGQLPDDELDGDGDGHPACAECDDDDPERHPDAQELCDGFDQDCDPFTHAPGELDADGDGWLACAECDDGEPATFPGAPELCDGFDNDCDGVADPDCGGWGGAYALDEPVTYSCAGGLVELWVDSLEVVDRFPAVDVIGPAPLDTLSGSFVGSDAFYVVSLLPGGLFGCTETYSLTASLSGDGLAGTLAVDFNGALCLDCTDQAWAITAAP